MTHRVDNILLVDDDSITNFLNRDIISKTGIARHVDVVEDGNEALEFVQNNWMKSHRPGEKETNLILLDINMPQMSAFQFLERFEMLQTENNICVVLLTTSNNERDIERARHFNVSSYVTKPLNSQKLYSILQIF